MTDGSGAPEVSVVIPTRNRWPLLSSNGLTSALCQREVEVEVIVVDDGSTDETPERLRALDDPRVRVIRNETSRGVARARNAGLAEARGAWVAWLDDDDVWSPYKLRRQLDAAAASDALFAYAGAIAIDERRTPLHELPTPRAADVRRLLLAKNAIPAGASNVMASTRALRELGGFDTQLHQLADWDLWIRLAQRGEAAASTEVLVAYVVHPASMFLTTSDPVVREFDYLAGKHRAVTAAEGVQLDRDLFRAWLATAARVAAHDRRLQGRRVAAARAYLRIAYSYRSGRDALRAAVALFGDHVMTLAAGRPREPVVAPTWLTAPPWVAA